MESADLDEIEFLRRNLKSLQDLEQAIIQRIIGLEEAYGITPDRRTKSSVPSKPPPPQTVAPSHQPALGRKKLKDHSAAQPALAGKSSSKPNAGKGKKDKGEPMELGEHLGTCTDRIKNDTGHGSGVTGWIANKVGWSQTEKLQTKSPEDTIRELQGELERTQGLLAAEQEQKDSLSDLVLELRGQRKGDTTVSGSRPKTHPDLERDYNSLFHHQGNTAADYLAGFLTYQSDGNRVPKKQTKEIVGKAFHESYQACKAAVLEAMFEPVFTPNQTGEQLEAAKDRAGVYGVCIATTPSLSSQTEKTELHKQILDKVKQQYQYCYPKEPSTKLGSRAPALNPFDEYLKAAIDVAWKMLTIQPPMIAAFPTETKYDRRVHDQDDWDKKLKEGEYDLVFFHPAVYNTYADKKPQVKAEVGNKPKLIHY